MEVRLALGVIILSALVRCGTAAGASCRAAGLCCDGRDSSCAVYRGAAAALSNVLLHRGEDQERPCYCDHACLKVGDCCPDFEQVCGAFNCEVSHWGGWSDCSADCGIGTMSRERRIIRSPSNGGLPCPELTQKRSCYGNQCDGKTHVKANRETAMILQATYSTIRHLNATQDIRNNLRLRYRKDPAEESSKEYCVMFEITKLRKACENIGSDISPKLTTGSTVCTVCENAAMRKHLGYRCQGHGVDQKTTRFTLLASPQCHGRWQRLEVKDKCGCHDDGKPDFIFV